jgi:uncharacterized heparinase superfamily protein
MAMARDARAERTRLALFLAGQRWRRFFTRLTANPLYRWRVALQVPERLLIAPQDLRTGDPTLASEIYAGRFAFGGKSIAVDGRSPFEIDPPSRDWAEALLGFAWLRHLRAAGTAIARQNARSLVDDWIALQGSFHPLGWDPDIVARRIVSWITQSPLILQDADHAFYRRFLRSLVRQVRYLKRTARETRDGYPRLLAAVALAFAGLCIADQARLLRAASRRLAEELDRQILPDGGHISRNPGILIEILLDLLPLRQAYEACNVPPPPALQNAIDRIMPMLRFFRHGDGAFAHFNGMGPTPADLLATVLAYDDARGAPVANAAHSGYQRLEAGHSLVIADAGKPPAFTVSYDAHAGCLSFEFSTGKNRVIVNCGMPVTNRDAWRQAARATAAHSTVTFNDTSSCRFLVGDTFSRFVGIPVISGPHDVKVTRTEREGAHLCRASHDGYGERFSIVHQRSWRLANDGTRLDGEDVFVGVDSEDIPQGVPDLYAIRFHLHPAVKASRRADGRSVLLVLPNNDSWLFTTSALQVDVEESVYLSAIDGPRRTSQIVIPGRAHRVPRVVWTLIRAEAPGTGERRTDLPMPELPL